MQIRNNEEYKFISIEDLEFTTRTYNALNRAGINTLFLLIENKDRLENVRNLGAKCFTEINDKLNKFIHENGLIDESQYDNEMSPNTDENALIVWSEDILSKSTDELRISTRIYNALKQVGIVTVGQVLDMTDEDIACIKNIGGLSKNQLQEEILQLRKQGEDYFDYNTTIETTEFGKREMDTHTIKRLQADYGFKIPWLCDWYGISRQRVYQKLEKKNHGIWCGKELLLPERKHITEMINAKQFYKETEDEKYFLLNNRKDDCAFIIVSQEQIKCFFLTDLPLALQALIKSQKLHKLSESEIAAEPSMVKFVHILKKKYVTSVDPATFHSFANARNMSNEEYAMFMFELPYCSGQASVTDEKIVAFLEENTINGYTSIPSTSENQWIRSFISRNGFSTAQFIKFYGFNMFNDDESYQVERDMESLKVDGDFIDKTYAEFPLLGSRIISQKNLETLNKNAKKYIDQMLADTQFKPSLKMEMQIALAVINYAKNWDVEDENAFRKYIALQFGYRDKKERLDGIIRGAVRNALLRNNRWFISDATGNHYKSSVMVHSFSTKKSWMYFCDFLFDFYKTNLNWMYIEGDPIFGQMVNALRNRLQDKKDIQDENIQIGAQIYNFREGIIKLILYRPQYASHLVESMIRRIDSIINHTAKPPVCYEEQLCDEWMANKLQVLSIERHRDANNEKRIIVIDYSRIHPVYQLYNEEEVRIVFPDVRLAHDNVESLNLCMYHQGDLIEQKKLIYYGNELGKTMAGFSLKLEEYVRNANADVFEPHVVISCNSDVIYDSEKTLYRDYLIFRGKNEVDIAACHTGGYSIFTPVSIKCEFLNAEVSSIIDTRYLKGDYVDLQENFGIKMNGQWISFDSSRNEELKMMVPQSRLGMEYIANGVRYTVVTEKEVIHIISQDRNCEKKYRLIVNEREFNISTLPFEDLADVRIYKLAIDDLGSDELSIRMLDLINNRMVIRCAYKVVHSITHRFNRPFYFTADDYRDARLKLQIDRGDVNEYPVMQGETMIQVPWQRGVLEMAVPVVYVEDNAGEVWDGTNLYWIKDISQDRFLKVNAPTGLEVNLTLDRKLLGTEGNLTFALGNALYGYTNIDEARWLKLGMTVSVNGDENIHYTLGKIAVKEQFNKTPILSVNESVLTWDRGYGFIGDTKGAFYLTICEGTEFEQTCPLDITSQEIMQNLELPLGEYQYSINKRSENLFSVSMQKLVSGKFYVGDENELRFLNRIIQIDTLTFEDGDKYETVEVRTFYIDNIEYKGIHLVRSEERECPIYNGIMYFVSDNGKRHEYSYEDTFDEKGHKLYRINPVRIVILNDNTLIITNETGDLSDNGEGFYYYWYYDKYRQKIVHQLTDWEPLKSNRDKYSLADLYSYKRKEV